VSELSPEVFVSTMTTLLNFSYGSNMLSARITQRVPSARAIGTAVLTGHLLRWHKAGQDGSAKCDIVATGSTDDRVIGVVYTLSAGEKHLLDAAEGLGNGYDEKEVVLESASGAITAWTYHATAIDTTMLPFDWYKALVVCGATEHGLPDAYVRQLQAVPAVADGDAERAQRHWCLLPPAWSGGAMLSAQQRVIVALDFADAAQARSLVAQLGDAVPVYKIGLQLLTAEGPALVRELVGQGKQVFLDLKLHEIPQSVAGAVAAAGALGVAMVTVHASGGSAVLRAAVEAARAYPQLKVLALTVITSMADADLREVGVDAGVALQVVRLAVLAAQAGCHGVIASPLEAQLLREHLPPGMAIVTPGTQLASDAATDQARTATPGDAIRSGASLVVMGRSITRATDPLAAFSEACAQVATALASQARIPSLA
jgi:orotidine-5'-phosphate decarboxylase